MRKPRSDSKLDGLDLDQQRQLCEWLLTPGLSYNLIVKQVFEEFDVSTSAAALSSFYRSYCGPYLLQRRREAVGLAEEVAEDAKRTPGQWDAATIEALQQKAFELANNPMVDPGAVKGIFALVLKARDQDLKKQDIEIKLRRLEMLEGRDADAKAVLADGAQTPESREARMKEIFGIA